MKPSAPPARSTSRRSGSSRGCASAGGAPNVSKAELDRIRRFVGLDAVRFADGYLRRGG